MLRKIAEYIAREQLLEADKLHLAALSGGADSVALLLALRQLGYRIEAVHCNFHLRGEESNRDEHFCQQLCSKHGIALHRIHFDTKAYAEGHKVSIEMAARELRYRYFEQLMHDIGAADVCVAHHQDDQVETILINLLRGTGIQGLTGMRPRRDYVVRPLLCVSRSEIEQWLDSQGQDYVVDSTNLQQDVVRNKIRLGVVPELLKVSPQASAAILHTAEQLRQTQLLADKYADEALLRLVDNDAVYIAALIQEPSPELLLYYWLTRYGFTSSVVRQIAERLPVARTGNCWTSATHEACVDRGRLLVSPIITPFKPMRIPEAGTYVLCDGSKMTIATSQDVSISHHRLVACLDADRVSFPLTIRRITEGDRMTPLGMKGTRLVSDMLTDAKMPMTAKKRQLAVCDSKGHIVWLPGVRPANDCRITPETHMMLRIEIVESTETHEG